MTYYVDVAQSYAAYRIPKSNGLRPGVAVMAVRQKGEFNNAS